MARDAPVAGEPPREAEPLYALPPARFVAERNALAKALAARDPQAAAAVRRLARPVGLAWVVNRLARERPDEVSALLAAGDRLRAGQRQAIAGRGAAAFREADEALRDAARALREAAGAILAGGAGSAAGARLARVELLLRAAAIGAPATREALRRGVLAREPEVAVGGFGPAGPGGLAAVPDTVAPARAPADRSASSSRARGAAARAGRGAPSAPADREAARRAAETARREARAREAALARASEAEARARRGRERAVTAAERALRAAEKARAAAEQEAVRRRAEAEAAAGRAREAEARLAAAVREVEARRAALGRAAGG